LWPPRPPLRPSAILEAPRRLPRRPLSRFGKVLHPIPYPVLLTPSFSKRTASVVSDGSDANSAPVSPASLNQHPFRC
jgi:hypothetical protein